MNQPELGKKIAELRKLKGLTQEELVDRCNLSVRTLQRIEYGEVTPRAYTLKLIYEALDFNVDKSFDPTLKGEKGLISNWLEQFYIGFIDLFNLKTHKMKKITILSIMLSAILYGVFGLVMESKAEKENTASVQVSDNTLKKDQKKGSEPVFSDFTAYGSFEENDELIGRDIKFRLNGVNVNVKLILINKKTREFNSTFVRGTLYQNKVEVNVSQDEINDNLVMYSADRVEKSKDKILLKGNAKLTSPQKDSIETDEIIISLN